MNRKPETTGFWRGRLPHWEVEDGRYFVTIHLAGTIPKQGEERIQQISIDLQQRESRTANDDGLPLMRTIFREMEQWIDRADHNTLLSEPSIADMVIEAIQHRVQTNRWQVFEHVIMANHCHLAVGVPGDPDPEELLRDFKSYGSRKLNRSGHTVPHDKRWTKSGSKRKLPDDESVLNAIQYTIDQEYPLVVWVNDIPERNLKLGRLV